MGRRLWHGIQFLSTLSLRRATKHFTGAKSHDPDFYPRSPCGERPPTTRQPPTTAPHFYPRSPCGERRVHYDNYNLHCVISIHALLAESDVASLLAVGRAGYFYPRSPCGERRRRSVKLFRQNYISIHALLAESDKTGERHANSQQEFLSTLSLRRATRPKFGEATVGNFYPRSPCGERPTKARRTTYSNYFYPRSPCGERRMGVFEPEHDMSISIHALLAESDYSLTSNPDSRPIFLSTLSLRRATVHSVNRQVSYRGFLSTLSLRRATIAVMPS